MPGDVAPKIQSFIETIGNRANTLVPLDPAYQSKIALWQERNKVYAQQAIRDLQKNLQQALNDNSINEEQLKEFCLAHLETARPFLAPYDDWNDVLNIMAINIGGNKAIDPEATLVLASTNTDPTTLWGMNANYTVSNNNTLSGSYSHTSRTIVLKKGNNNNKSVTAYYSAGSEITFCKDDETKEKYLKSKHGLHKPVPIFLVKNGEEIIAYRIRRDNNDNYVWYQVTISGEQAKALQGYFSAEKDIVTRAPSLVRKLTGYIKLAFKEEKIQGELIEPKILQATVEINAKELQQLKFPDQTNNLVRSQTLINRIRHNKNPNLANAIAEQCDLKSTTLPQQLVGRILSSPVTVCVTKEEAREEQEIKEAQEKQQQTAFNAQEIELALNFLAKNIEFFQLFLHQNEALRHRFQREAFLNEMVKWISQMLWYAFDNQQGKKYSAFIDALMGNTVKAQGSSLVVGQQDKMKQVLNENPRLVAVLLWCFSANSRNIDNFYKKEMQYWYVKEAWKSISENRWSANKKLNDIKSKVLDDRLKNIEFIVWLQTEVTNYINFFERKKAEFHQQLPNSFFFHEEFARAEKAAEKLISSLQNAHDKITYKASSLREATDKLIKNCNTALQTARPVLEEFRGWGNILANGIVFFTIVGALCMGLSYLAGGQFCLIRSDSEERVKELESTLSLATANLPVFCKG